MPMGKMGGQQFGRLIMGGNLFGGCSHSRELSYVGTLLQRYNTEAKIQETLDISALPFDLHGRKPFSAVLCGFGQNLQRWAMAAVRVQQKRNSFSLALRWGRQSLAALVASW
jgi:hypothetical protein